MNLNEVKLAGAKIQVKMELTRAQKKKYDALNKPSPADWILIENGMPYMAEKRNPVVPELCNAMKLFEITKPKEEFSTRYTPTYVQNG